MRTSLPFAASSPFSTSLSRWLGVGDGTRSMDRVPASGEDIATGSWVFRVFRFAVAGLCDPFSCSD